MVTKLLRTSVVIGDDLKAALAELKERDGIPESESIRRALRAYLKDKGITIRPAGASTGRSPRAGRTKGKR